MPIEVEGPDGAILEFPDGTSREVMRAAMAKRYGAKGNPALEKLAQQGFQMANIGTQMVQQRLGTKPKMSRTQAFVSGVERGVKPVGEFVEKYNPVLAAVNAIQGKGAQSKRTQVKNRMAAQARTAEAERPGYYTAGEITGQTLATAPLMPLAGAAIEGTGAALANVAPKIGKAVQAVGAATKTGGMTSGLTKQEIAAMSKGERIANLALRSAGGAVAGATSAGLTGQDVVTGAEYGAGLPIVGNILGKLGGKVVDLTRMTKLKAAKLIREALGKDEAAARAAFEALSPDDQRLARQVLVDAGVEPDTFMALGADVEKLKPTETRAVLEAQEAARNARLAQAAGGATATEARASGELARQNVSAATQPQAQAALERANVAGRVVPTADELAQAARQEADRLTASGIVPRMRGLETRSRDQLDAVFQNPEFFTQGNPVERIGAIADKAGQRADDVINAQLGLRDTARDMESLVADMAAEGMQPLRVGPIVSQLRTMANAPGTRADVLQRGTLVKLAKQLEGLADENGVIDARDLYQIRKTGLNDIVERLLGSRAQPSSGTKERTAALLTSLRPMIDDAIEASGGTNWKDYLVRTRQGFEAVNRQELAAKGAQLGKESPDELAALMAGERPDIVEGILGKGTKQYDIAGMALADPQRYLALKSAADEIVRNNRMTELAQSGRVAANELMGRETPNKLRSLTRMGLSTVPAGRIALEGGEQFVSQLMRPKIGRTLAEGMLSGRNALDLMNQYPTATTIAGQVSRVPAPVLNALAQMMRGWALSDNSTAP